MSHIPKSLPFEPSNNLLPCLIPSIPFLLAFPTIPVSTCQNQIHLEASPPSLNTDLQWGRQRRRDSVYLEWLLVNFLLLWCLKDDVHCLSKKTPKLSKQWISHLIQCHSMFSIQKCFLQFYKNYYFSFHTYYYSYPHGAVGYWLQLQEP